MFAAVHSDRSGRVVLSADYAAAASNGVAQGAFAHAIALPDDAEVVSLPDRIAVGLDRTGKPRPLGQGRWVTAAILPPGYVRVALPAYLSEPRAPALAPRGYAAVASDGGGALVVSALALDDDVRGADGRADPGLRNAVSTALRDDPSSRVVRQLARCARDYRCRAAANAFLARADAALPVGAPSNEHSADGTLVRATADATPTETAAFHPSADEIADLAAAHLDGGGSMVAFGRECEGEPLLAVRVIEPAIRAIRERTRRGTIHLESNGSVPAAIARLAAAGLDSIAFRIVSARADTYERLHRPSGYRFTDVRASIAEAVAAGMAVALVLVVMPGLTDTERELEAIIALAGELPRGGELLLRDLAADPDRVRELVPSVDAPIGVVVALERIRAEAPHLRIGALARPLTGV